MLGCGLHGGQPRKYPAAVLTACASHPSSMDGPTAARRPGHPAAVAAPGRPAGVSRAVPPAAGKPGRLACGGWCIRTASLVLWWGRAAAPAACLPHCHACGCVWPTKRRRRRMPALPARWCRPSTSSCSPAARCRWGGVLARLTTHSHLPGCSCPAGLQTAACPTAPSWLPALLLQSAGAAGTAAEQPAVGGSSRGLHPALLLLELQLRRLAGARPAGPGESRR